MTSIDERKTSIKGLPEIVDSLEAAFKTMCITYLSGVVTKFTHRVAEEGGKNQAELIKLWNEVAPEYNIKDGKAAKSNSKSVATIQGKICTFYFKRSKKNCDCEVSVKSVTESYCSKHLKEEGKEPAEKPASKSDADVPKKQCCYKTIKGKEPGKQCAGNVSDKSASGKYCSRHFKSEENVAGKVKEPKNEEEKSVQELVIVPKLNRALKVYVDQETQFIIDKASTKIYGRVRAGKITPLEDEDIAFLKMRNYEYDDTLFIEKHPELVPNSDDESGIEDESEEDD